MSNKPVYTSREKAILKYQAFPKDFLWKLTSEENSEIVVGGRATINPNTIVVKTPLITGGIMSRWVMSCGNDFDGKVISTPDDEKDIWLQSGFGDMIPKKESKINLDNFIWYGDFFNAQELEEMDYRREWYVSTLFSDIVDRYWQSMIVTLSTHGVRDRQRSVSFPLKIDMNLMEQFKGLGKDPIHGLILDYFDVLTGKLLTEDSNNHPS